jgi:hypothetical protein
MLPILVAIASASANALNAVTQHVASTAAPPEEKGWRLAAYLVRSPLWLFGVVAMIAGFALQALALEQGRESVVQSVLVSEIVFSLVIGRVWLRRTVAAAAWASSVAAAGGLAIFLVMSEPEGGHAGATGAAWPPALLVCGLLTGGCAAAARSHSTIRRAAFYGGAAGITGAVFATLLKSVADDLARHGVVAVLGQAPLYGLIVVGMLVAVFTQAALHNRPLAVSQPMMLIVNPVVSIALGIWIFGEHFGGGWWKVAVGLLGFVTMALGVVSLARAAPSLAAASAEPPT